MITIHYESHATSIDNVARRASGHDDVPLHEIGEAQARQMGLRYAGAALDIVFCSDLQRAYRTAEIAFAGRNLPIIKDRRLRELDYGDWTGRSVDAMQAERGHRVTVPFPNGESYVQSAARIKAFLTDLLRDHEGKTVLVIGHRATHYGLEHWISGKPLAQLVAEERPWAPGQVYLLTGGQMNEVGHPQERQG